VAGAYSDVIERFLGADKPMRFVEAEKPGFFKRLFGGAEAMSFLSFSWARRRRPPASPRSACRSSWRTSAGRNAAEPDYLPELQRELIAVISKYVKIDPKDIKVNLERQDDLEVLEVKIELPEKADKPGKLNVQPG
jgi:cell division topological specificity factor